jgi:hypothetical protein
VDPEGADQYCSVGPARETPNEGEEQERPRRCPHDPGGVRDPNGGELHNPGGSKRQATAGLKWHGELNEARARVVRGDRAMMRGRRGGGGDEGERKGLDVDVV